MANLTDIVQKVNYDVELDKFEEYTVEKMIHFTKTNNLSIRDLQKFISKSEIDETNYIKIPDHLLNKIFAIFTLYFRYIWHIPNKLTLDFNEIVKITYLSCSMDNFFFKIRKIYLNIVDVSPKCFSTFELLFKITSAESTSPCVFVNKVMFSHTLKWCNRIHSRLQSSQITLLPKIHNVIKYILQVEYSIKSYNFNLETLNKLKEK